MTTATAITPGVQTLIMAGGRGERLYPLTASRPKPAVAIRWRFRIVDFTLSNCLNSGLSRVSLLTQYRHEELQSYIRAKLEWLWTEMMRETLFVFHPAETTGIAEQPTPCSKTLQRCGIPNRNSF